MYDYGLVVNEKLRYFQYLRIKHLSKKITARLWIDKELNDETIDSIDNTPQLSIYQLVLRLPDIS